MTEEQSKKILDLLADFFKQNEGNRLNKYLTIPFLQVMSAQLHEIVKIDSKGKGKGNGDTIQ